MPFTFTCADHPDEDMHYVEDILAHRRSGCKKPVTQHFESQTVAQGNTPILIGGCRRCGHIGSLRDDGTCHTCPPVSVARGRS